MNNKAPESGHIETPPSHHAPPPVFGTSMGPKQAPLHLPKHNDRQWPDLRCNKELDAEFARFFLTKHSSNVASGRT